MALEIYTDGGARGNPGPAGAGILIRDDQGRTILEAGYFLGRMTNNLAEYTALILALQAAARFGADEVVIHSDSELMVRQLTGQYRVRDPKLAEMFQKAQRLLLTFDAWRVKHVPRDQNRRADNLVNQALDARADVVRAQLGDARPDDRPSAPPRKSPARKGAVDVAARPSAAEAPCVVVRVVRSARPGLCQAGMHENQEFIFGDTVPQGMCIYAAKAAIDTALAFRHAAREEDDPGPVRVGCGRPGCGAQFEIRIAPTPGQNQSR